MVCLTLSIGSCGHEHSASIHLPACDRQDKGTGLPEPVYCSEHRQEALYSHSSRSGSTNSSSCHGKYIHMFQSRVEIEDYSVMYFDRNSEFEAPYTAELQLRAGLICEACVSPTLNESSAVYGALNSAI